MRRVRTTLALFAGLAVVAVASTMTSAAGADTAWGSDGADYSGGILCALPGGETVPMATWSVAGVSTFALRDVTARNGVFDPAPTNGGSGSPTAGSVPAATPGLTDATIPALAYLIAHHGSATTNSAPEVAETSAVVAAVAGSGAEQERCLGQQGTSAADATALWAQAQQYAGPFTVTVTSPPPSAPGTVGTVTAHVASASGVGVPGLPVNLQIGNQAVSVTTGATGDVAVRAATPAVRSTTITATVSEPSGLTYFATDPPAVGLAAPTPYRATGSITAILHPHPVVSAAGSAPLILTSGTVVPTARVDGTDGFPGTGTLTVLGPVPPPAGRACPAVAGSDLAHAAVAWSGTFTVAGDGVYRADPVSGLAAGCYVVHAGVALQSTPVANATSAVDADAGITVSAIQLGVSAGHPVSSPGALTATETIQDAGAATVSTTITERGPLPPRDGACGADLAWSSAPEVATSAPITQGGQGTHAAVGDRPSSVSIPGAKQVGCYGFASRSVINDGGRTLVVETTAGGPSTTTLVVAPTLTVTDADYDGLVGASMHGSLQLSGAYRFPGVVTIGLVSAPAPLDGCRTVRFPAGGGSGARTSVSTSGDGTYDFRTPVATANRCYGVTATLTLTANTGVQASAPPPSATSLFLAGFVASAPAVVATDVPQPTGMAGAVTVAVVALLVVLAVGFGVIAAVAQRRDAGAAPA